VSDKESNSNGQNKDRERTMHWDADGIKAEQTLQAAKESIAVAVCS
jgi:hypothetical protein